MLLKCCTQMPANLESSAVARGQSVFIPVPKKGSAILSSSHHRTIALISHASKIKPMYFSFVKNVLIVMVFILTDKDPFEP